jgi:drug/metabolite transporter (DMT)-like permease
VIFVVLSVLCSVLVSVLLKLARRFELDIGQMVMWNYVVASALTALVLHPSWQLLREASTPWPALIGLGILLPTIFVALGASVRHAGIVRSDAAQRLSLLISLLAAFVLFGEQLTAIKGIGIAVGFLALLCLVWRKKDAAENSGAASWLYPLLVLCGFGIIDILFKRVALAGLPLGTSLQAMFALALPVALALQLWRCVRQGARFTARSAAGGVLLGALNFGNIYVYLRAHQALPQHPALVFTGVSIGVVALAALTGMAVFRERLSAINLLGVALALGAIVLIAAG